jgi:carboxylesterase
MSTSNPMPVVLLHGLLSTPREFGLISLPLRAAGIQLITPEIANYTEADRSSPRRWGEWLASVEEAVRREVPAGQPFVLGGLCTGSLLAAALAISGRLPVHTLVMMSPTFAFDGWGKSALWRWRGLAYLLGITRWISTAERSPYGIKNEKLRQWVARDMERKASSAAGPSKLALWAVRETERLSSYIQRNLHRLPKRNVVLHAREDEVCGLTTVDRAFRAMPGADNEMIVLENSFHMITLDNDRRRVVDELRRAADPTRAPAPRHRAAEANELPAFAGFAAMPA